MWGLVFLSLCFSSFNGKEATSEEISALLLQNGKACYRYSTMRRMSCGGGGGGGGGAIVVFDDRLREGILV